MILGKQERGRRTYKRWYAEIQHATPQCAPRVKGNTVIIIAERHDKHVPTDVMEVVLTKAEIERLYRLTRD